MVLIKSLAIAALAAVAAAKSAVIDLTPANFDKVVLDSGKPTLVEFFAPWCGHCKTLAPVYEELATALEYAKDKVQIAKVDADAEKTLGKRFGIQGFPTLKWFDGKSDKPEDYSSGRDLESLTAFVAEKTGIKQKKKAELPSQVDILNDESSKKLFGSDKNVLVAFTAPWCGHCKKLAPTWETLATDYANDDTVVIAKIDIEEADSKAVTKQYEVTSFPTIKFFPAGSSEAVDYKGQRNEDSFIHFINEKAGTHRVVGGGLDDIAGTVASLNEIVAKLTSADKLTEVTSELQKAVGGLQDEAQKKYAEYYVRVFDKLKASNGFVAKEAVRLDGILQKGGLAPSKVDQIKVKVNVLSHFAKALGEKIKLGRDEL